MNSSAIMVLYYNKPRLTEGCVSSVLAAGYPPERVFCFDNGSRGEVFEEISRLFPQCRHQRGEKNGGYSVGFNRGLEWLFSSGHNSALFLTNDTAVYPGCLENCLETARQTGAGMTAPCIIYQSTAGGEHEAIDSTGGWFDGTTCRLNHWQEKNLPLLLQPGRDYIPGTALWISEETFRRLGGTDESYHMYWEDVDLCFRAHEQGIPLARCYEAKVSHGVGQTCRKKPLYTTFYFHRNRIRFCRRYLSGAVLEQAKTLLESEFMAMGRAWRDQDDQKRLRYLDQLLTELRNL